MLTLGINGWRIQGNRTGVGRYLLNVVSNWNPEVVAGRFDAIRFYTPVPLGPEGVSLPAAIEPRVVRPNWKMLVWENTRFAAVADEDVLFCPSYSRPLVARGRTVVTTYDVTHRLHPELFPAKVRLFYDRLYRWSARHATLVVTATEAARQDIARVWGVPLGKIRPVSLAIADAFHPVSDGARLSEVAPRFLGASVPYFLFVGKMSGRRNLPLLLRAFAKFKRRTRAPHRLLLVGLRLERLGLGDLLRDLGIAEDVHQSGYVTDEDLNLIYNAAQAFLMPSAYETISLPIMESQAVGTPVMCVDTPGSREVTGGSALMIESLHDDHVCEAMERLAEDAGLRRQLAAGGLSNARRYSWRRCAAETLDVLMEAATL